MEPLTRWETFVNWLWWLVSWRQCPQERKIHGGWNYCQRHRWHRGECVDVEGVRWKPLSDSNGQEKT